MKRVPYFDMIKLTEDRRIDMIGHRAIDHKEIVAVLVDYDGGAKGDRYIFKLQQRFLGIRILYRGPGPIDGVELIKVGPAKDGANA